MFEKSYLIDRTLQEALALLKIGQQERAKDCFSYLLREDPENLEYQAGFFCTGWWLNRSSSRYSYRNGRPLATWLMKEWEKFAKQAKERDYSHCLSFQSSMQCILQEAAENFRKAFHEEWPGSTNVELLRELSICFIQLEDYTNAVDILKYALSKKAEDAHLCFLLGESLCCLPQKKQVERGLSYYRNAFLIDFQVMEPKWMSSETAVQVFEEIRKDHQEASWEEILNWFPAYIQAFSFSYCLLPLKPSQIETLYQEVSRLSQQKKKVIDKYRNRTQANLCFYLLVILYHFFIVGEDRYSVQTYEAELREEMPRLYAYYEKRRTCENKGNT